jgi:hypothetical protein
MMSVGRIEMEARLRQSELAQEIELELQRKRMQGGIVRVVRPRFSQSEFFTRRFGMLTGRIKTQPA